MERTCSRTWANFSGSSGAIPPDSKAKRILLAASSALEFMEVSPSRGGFFSVAQCRREVDEGMKPVKSFPPYRLVVERCVGFHPVLQNGQIPAYSQLPTPSSPPPPQINRWWKKG